MRRFTRILQILIILMCVASRSLAAMELSSGSLRITADRQGARWVGFDLYSQGRLVAPVRLSSNGIIAAKSCRVERNPARLVFSSLQALPGCGLEFGNRDNISVALIPNVRYPRIAFHITIRRFNSSQWLAVVGKSPFHFLSLYMPDAMAWHAMGWLNATPLADRFPLLEDVHIGSPELSAYHYNRNWSYTPALGAQPVPVIGLWAPQKKLYAGYEFQSTRMTDNSEKFVATGYCWKEALAASPTKYDRQFISLVYPYGGVKYQSLVFPNAGDVISSHGYLLWNQTLSASKDPNELLWSFLWNRYRAYLPQVPKRVDLSWVPGGDRLKDFDGPPNGNIIGGVEKQFQTPGSKIIYGWNTVDESMVDVPYRNHDTVQLEYLRHVARELIGYAKWFRIPEIGTNPVHFLSGAPSTNGKPLPSNIACYWEKPLTGSWTPDWGGESVTTLHNCNGLVAARLLMDLYRDEGDSRYLPYVQGAFHWARDWAWERNGLADVPSSPFAIDGSVCESFCLDYYFTFKNDPVYASDAKEALQLARSFAYRYMTMWPSDNNRDDNMDSAFLWSGNSGSDWIGTPSANEICEDLDTLGMVAVETGDPILMYALQGSFDRWSALYQDTYHRSVEEYPSEEMVEQYGLFPGNPYWEGKRSNYGFSQPFPMEWPVGATKMRVLCGEKAAMAFDKDGADTGITGYRYQSLGNFLFKVTGSDRSPFSVSLSCPFVDISGKPVVVIRDGKRMKLRSGTDLIRPPQALWSLIIHNITCGDEIIVGNPKGALPILPSQPPLTRTLPSYAPPSGFQFARISFNVVPDTSWSHLNSWAGLWRGVRWVCGVPFELAPASQKSAIKGRERLLHPLKTDIVFLLFSNGSGPAPELLLRNGKRVVISSNHTGLAWRAWPPIYTERLLMGWAMVGGDDVVAVDARSRLIFACTGVKRDRVRKADLEYCVADLRRLNSYDRFVSTIRSNLADVPRDSFAIIPPMGASAAAALLGATGLSYAKADILTPEQLVDPNYFNVERFPIAFFVAGGEDYIQTVHAPDDAANAVVNYVKNGGMLVYMVGGPSPMAYGTGPNGYIQTIPAPLTNRMDFPLENTIETLPNDKLTVELIPGQTVIPNLAKSFPYPAGDPRLRALVKDHFPTGVVYQPIYRVVGASGKSYGVAAAMMSYPGGGRILYISDVLTSDPKYGPPLIAGALEWIKKAEER
jgi:hypothetical protein